MNFRTFLWRFSLGSGPDMVYSGFSSFISSSALTLDKPAVCWCVVLPASWRRCLQNKTTMLQQHKCFLLIVTKGQLRLYNVRETELQRGGGSQCRARALWGNTILRPRNTISLSHRAAAGLNQLSRVKLDNASVCGTTWTYANSHEETKNLEKVVNHDGCVHSHHFIISFLYSTTSQTRLLKFNAEISETERWGSYRGSKRSPLWVS